MRNRCCSSTHASTWLAKDATLIRNGEFYGIEHLLSAFGGMGSLNALVLHPINGHSISDADANQVNEDLQAMLAGICGKARKLAREDGHRTFDTAGT